IVRECAVDRKWVPSRVFGRPSCDDVVRFVRGEKMATFEALSDEISAAWQFPTYYGENWPALDEMLKSVIEWTPPHQDSLTPSDAYVFLVKNTHLVMPSAGDDVLGILYQILSDTGKYYAAHQDNGPI